MAQEIVIRNLCDICLAADKEKDAETYHVAVTIAGEPDSPRPFVVELCGEHGSELAKAVTSLVTYGRPPEKTVPASAPGPARKAAMPDPDKRAVCPACGVSYGSAGSLRGHVRKEHNETLAGIGFYPANFVCSGCGDAYPNRQGLSAHSRIAHPGIKQSA